MGRGLQAWPDDAGSDHVERVLDGDAATPTIQAQRLEAGSFWEDKGLVFSNAFGGPLDPARVNEAFHRALSKAGLPRIRVHDLRHTAATLLLERGVHPKAVQEFLGHSTITLTLDTYSHVMPSLHAEVASHMEALFQRSLK